MTFKIHLFQKDLKVNLIAFFAVDINMSSLAGSLLSELFQFARKHLTEETEFSFVKEPSAGQSVESGVSVDSLVTSNLAKFNLNQLGFDMRGSQVSSEADSLTYNFLLIVSLTCSM